MCHRNNSIRHDKSYTSIPHDNPCTLQGIICPRNSSPAAYSLRHPISRPERHPRQNCQEPTHAQRQSHTVLTLSLNPPIISHIHSLPMPCFTFLVNTTANHSHHPLQTRVLEHVLQQSLRQKNRAGGLPRSVTNQ